MKLEDISNKESSMKLEDMSNMDLSYIEGFVEKCAAHNVDPELFLESLLSKKSQAGDGETQKPNPGGSDKGEDKKEESKPSKKPDYEKRRKGTTIALGGLGGGMIGAARGLNAAGFGATKAHRAMHGAAGGLVGAGLGAGAAALYNVIRGALGFSAMGTPVTLGKDIQ